MLVTTIYESQTSIQFDSFLKVRALHNFAMPISDSNCAMTFSKKIIKPEIETHVCPKAKQIHNQTSRRVQKMNALLRM